MRNVLHSFRHSNSWFSVGGAVLGGLGNAVLLEEVCNYGELCKHVQPYLTCSFLSASCLCLKMWVLSTMPATCCCALPPRQIAIILDLQLQIRISVCCHAFMDTHTGSASQKNSFFSWYISTATGTTLIQSSLEIQQNSQRSLYSTEMKYI